MTWCHFVVFHFYIVTLICNTEHHREFIAIVTAAAAAAAALLLLLRLAFKMAESRSCSDSKASKFLENLQDSGGSKCTCYTQCRQELYYYYSFTRYKGLTLVPVQSILFILGTWPLCSDLIYAHFK
jgi:hypothetical protein